MVEIHEEYLLRQKIDYPLIKYYNQYNKFNFVLQNLNDKKQILVQISHVKENNKPIYYSIVASEMYRPHNNDINDGGFPQRMLYEVHEVYWDDYPIHLQAMFSKPEFNGFTPIEFKDLNIKMFGFYLLLADSWIAKFVPYSTQKNIGKIISSKTKEEEKIALIKEYKEYIYNNFTSKLSNALKIFEGYNEQKTYADWMSSLYYQIQKRV